MMMEMCPADDDDDNDDHDISSRVDSELDAERVSGFSDQRLHSTRGNVYVYVYVRCLKQPEDSHGDVDVPLLLPVSLLF